MKKNNLLLVLIPALVLAVAIPVIIISLSKDASKDKTSEVEHSTSIAKDGEAETTALPANSGEETQETSEDQLVLFDNPDEQTEQEIYDNEILIASIPGYMYGGLGMNASVGIATCICTETIEMNDFIDSYLGWPENDTYPESEYASSRLYISQLIGSMDGSTDLPPTNLYSDTPFAAQQYAVRYSISNRSQFPLDGSFSYYSEMLSEYMKSGHPKITTIHSMVLSVDDPKVFADFNGNSSNLQATIQTDVGEYFVYLIYVNSVETGEGFQILDMIQLS